ATATLEVINDLDGLKSKIDGLNHRAGAMRAERDAFADAVAGLAAALPDVPAGHAVETCRWLEERLRTARSADVERRSLAAQLAIRSTARDRASEKLRRSSAALTALCVEAGAADPSELVEIERRSAEKRDAERERGQIETRVREDGDGRDVAALF